MKSTCRINKPDTASKLVLEEVIGLTTKNGNGLASNGSSSKCAYLAGSVVVLYDVNLGTQSHLMVSHRLPKPLSCVALSRDGCFVAAGEAGSQSSVVVWDCSTLSVVSQLKGHLYGVTCMCFSPSGKHLVSVGAYIYLWNWRSCELVTKVQAASTFSDVSSVSFSSDAKFIITAGKKHLKFWVLRSSKRTQINGAFSRLTSIVIHEKPSNLAIHKGSSLYIASSVGSNSGYDNCKQAGDCFPIYALTDSGILHLIHSGLLVKKSVALKVQKAFALSTSGKLIACACNNGAVQLFTPMSLEYVGNILYSKAKIFYEENNTICQQDFQNLLALPDAVACQFAAFEKLVVIYRDHSLYIWDIHDVNQATRCFVLVSHSSCIWDIKNLCCENMHDPSLACTARGCSGGISFATCSADGTIRLWDLALQSESAKDAEEHHLLKMELLSSSCLVSAGTFERDAVKADLRSQEFRSLAVSSDGKYLAAGDCRGNLHVYNLQTSDYTCFQGAHDAEILTLSFTQDMYENITKNNYFLASGGRDCMIHLYDVNRNFDLIQSIDDHLAAVTSVKISSNSCRILSCSADSFLVLRDVVVADNGYKILQQHRQKASTCGTVYDMAVDWTFKTVVTVGQALVLGAIYTSTVTHIWAMCLLLNNPQGLEKVNEEIDVYIRKERCINEADINKLVYLQTMVIETLRLYPASPLSGVREFREDCTLGGFHVKKGTRLMTNLWMIQMDPSIWEDPLEFKPERFLTTHKEVDVKGHHFEFIPFGSRRRICPGQCFKLQLQLWMRL